MKLTRKDEMELHYWKTTENREYHRAKLAVYLWAWGHYNMPQSVLEIGCGPFGGFLPFLTWARRRIGVDPLIDDYRAAGLLPEIGGVEYIPKHFEEWIPYGETFDAIFAADALDHGEMGFDLLPRIAALLNPGGRLYIHVNLRPAEKLNAIHDHGLTIQQLESALDAAFEVGIKLEELRKWVYPNDVDGAFDCPTLIGVWERYK